MSNIPSASPLASRQSPGTERAAIASSLAVVPRWPDAPSAALRTSTAGLSDRLFGRTIVEFLGRIEKHFACRALCAFRVRARQRASSASSLQSGIEYNESLPQSISNALETMKKPPTARLRRLSDQCMFQVVMHICCVGRLQSSSRPEDATA